MITSLDMAGLGRLTAKLGRIENLNLATYAPTAFRIITEDNRRGVLAGRDKDDQPMRPVTYRPVGKAKPLTAAQRNTSNSRSRRGSRQGLGPMAAGLHGNLSSSEYRKLDGPPLAPRRQFSRVITNLQTGMEVDSGRRLWTFYGFWFDVVNRDGVRFLGAHFKGSGRLPVRNLCGLRRWGRAEARRTFVNWASDQIRFVLRRSA